LLILASFFGYEKLIIVRRNVCFEFHKTAQHHTHTLHVMIQMESKQKGISLVEFDKTKQRAGASELQLEKRK